MTTVGEELCFRNFRLLPGARILLKQGRPVELGSRAFDLLHVLLISRGAIVSKPEIVRYVWPTTLVDDGNLRFQISALRKALGEDRDLIKTIPGRGYLLAADISVGPAGGIAVYGAARTLPVLDDATRGQMRRGFASSAEGARGADDRAAAMLDDARETCEALRGLLRSVLDELWQMTARGEQAGVRGATGGPRLIQHQG